MKQEAHESIEETLSMGKREFIDRCLEWKKKFNNDQYIKVDKPTDCPIAQWVIFNTAKCHRELVPGTAACPMCGLPMCPDCGNHHIEQISRVTGYLSSVGSWNEAKKQEFDDRTRYDVAGRNR